jgi:hypothetical protein
MLQVLVLREGWEAVGKDAVRQGEEEYIFLMFAAMPRCYIPLKNREIWKKLDGLVENGGGEGGGTINC